ncbi:MAG: amidohydrolase [Clostridia bacterium]|nr:amidohydrolase [Clostridia bacterium]
MDFKKEIEQLIPELIELRRDFHRHPEIGFQEFRTANKIEEYLKSLGIETRRCLETGVIGLLKGGKPGKTVCLRSDIDALPVQEETGLPFASENPGVMHACGHDGHMSMLLTTAKIMSQHKDEIPGTVMFLFQTNEEDAGAQDMIDAGALEAPKPDAIFGMHLWAYSKSGYVGMVPGALMASSWYFTLNIHGKGGHGGAPHTCINPIDCAMHVLQAFQTFHTLENDSKNPTTITVGKLQAGRFNIIVPDDCLMEGSIRCLHTGDAAVRERIREMVDGVCKTYRCTYDLEFKCGNSLLNNDPELSKLIYEATDEVFGEGHIDDTCATMIGEDFAEFLAVVPGAFCFLGVADHEKGTDYEHHNCKFNIDEDVLPKGVEMQCKLITKYLGF